MILTVKDYEKIEDGARDLRGEKWEEREEEKEE